MRTSEHYTQDRATREWVIKEIIGYGKPVAEFVVDRGHKNGAEIHEITDTGIVNVYNKRTHKLVTKLIARPGQLRRYFPNGNAPKNLIEKAVDNTVKNRYNEL